MIKKLVVSLHLIESFTNMFSIKISMSSALSVNLKICVSCAKEQTLPPLVTKSLFTIIYSCLYLSGAISNFDSLLPLFFCVQLESCMIVYCSWKFYLLGLHKILIFLNLISDSSFVTFVQYLCKNRIYITLCL